MRVYLLRPSVTCLGGLLLFWAGFSRPLAAPEPAPSNIDTNLPAPDESAASIVQRFESITSEETGRDLINQAVAGLRPGAEGFFSHKNISELRQSDIADLARGRNLAVIIQQRARDVADAALTGAAAAFDPFFSVTLNHQRLDAGGRTDEILRLREKFSQFDPDQFQKDFFSTANGQPAVNSNFVCVIVDGQLVNGNTDPNSGQGSCTNDVILNKQTEHASGSFYDQFLWGAEFGLLKNFQWGGNVQADLTVNRRKKDFWTFPDFLEGPVPNIAGLTTPPLNIGSRLPWTSNLSLSFSTPLPYARNFGEYGNTQSIGIKQAVISLQEAEWRIEAVSNQVLGGVVGGVPGMWVQYWSLVGALKQIEVIAAQRQILEQIVASTRRQFDQQLVTAYDMAQAEAQMENLRDREQIAWNNYVLASNAVAELLDYPPDTIVVPSGYTQAFGQDYAVDATAVRRTALDNRRELKISQGEVEKAQINLKFAENQVRPELSFSASAALNQFDTAFGYRNVESSLMNLVEPDASDFFVGVSYRLPFGLQAEKAQLQKARLAVNTSVDNQSQTELGITQQVNNALAQFLSARTQRQLAQQNMELAELAYAKVERLKNLGLASQFELLRTLSDMLDARSRYIDATVSYHQAYVQLQASQGLYE